MSEVAPPERPDLMALQVLHERAAHGDVDHLLPATDAEHGDLPFARLTKQVQLGLVELGVGLAQILVAPLSIKRRIHVPTSWQQEPIDVRECRGARDEVDTLRARGYHRAAVRAVILQAA